DRVTIDYEKGNQAQALLFLGWLASRLQWTPTAYAVEGGDYDLRRVKFVATGSGDYDGTERVIEAELAGLPVANAGSIQGDLVGLRLSSTNLQADCCTVLCSESTGCMRMEAAGGAQACHIEQVTPIAERKTEQLLTQQLQRLGSDALYEESLAAVANMLKLRS
ncbi:MAG: OpcA/G6PD domain-containing protein, partial [Cyanobacteria bacterium J06641_5]